MGKVIIQEYTMKNPLQIMGVEAATCWGGKVTDTEKNIARGKDCILSGHGRVMEYAEAYLVLDDYSARVIREFYTHIGGSPTRLQSSTRYIDYESGFTFVTPPSIGQKEYLKAAYDAAMKAIQERMKYLEEEGVPREDCAMLLPLGMTTRVVVRINARTLMDMSRQRMCTRAYWEFRQLFKDIYNALSEYSDEWKWICENCFMPKCEILGNCLEKKGCGKFPKRDDKQ